MDVKELNDNNFANMEVITNDNIVNKFLYKDISLETILENEFLNANK